MIAGESVESTRHGAANGAALSNSAALSNAGRHARANACIYTLAQTDRAPVIVS